MKNNKYMSFPRNVVGNLPLSKLLMKEKKQPYLIKQAEDPRQKPSGMTSLFDNGNNDAGFTLIELLVVVLIIGILAAVALPQYQKAVAKSRVMQVLPYIQAVYDAEQVYYLANGTYAETLDELAVDSTCPNGWSCYLGIEPTRPSLKRNKVQATHNDLNIHIIRYYGPLPNANLEERYRGKTYCSSVQTNTKGVQICKSFGPLLDDSDGYSRYIIQ